MNNAVHPQRPLAQVVSDATEEIKEFAQTRFALLKAELKQKFHLLKVGVLLAAVAGILLATAYILLTLALVALVASAFPGSPFRWVFGFLAVGVSWAILGGIVAYFARREFVVNSLTPERTIQVLKGDKIWIQSEAKSTL
jgi:Putative Actinobacterial Holin-X, holin superfamily III